MGKETVKSKWSQIKLLFQIGVTIITAAGILSLSKDRIAFLFSSESFPYFPEQHLQLLLIIATLFLIFQWIRIHWLEIDLLKDNLKNFLPSIPKASFSLMVLLATILGILGYLSTNIILYCSIFVLFSIFDIWATNLRNLTIKAALKKARGTELNDNQIKNLLAIEQYYIEKPHLQRSATVMFFSFISLIFGLLAQLYPDPKLFKIFTSLAYSLMSLNILISEIIINLWRNKRDKILDEQSDK